MPASVDVRIFLENDRQFTTTPDASREILERMTDDEIVLACGVASVGKSLGYYVATPRGIHYTDRQKTGIFSKRDVSGFLDITDIDEMYVEQFRNIPQYAFLRIYGCGTRLASISFEDVFCDGNAYGHARRVAEALGEVSAR
jgi:hypothetical protein